MCVCLHVCVFWWGTIFVPSFFPLSISSSSLTYMAPQLCRLLYNFFQSATLSIPQFFNVTPASSFHTAPQLAYIYTPWLPSPSLLP